MDKGAVKWMKSYLNNRRHRVICNRTTSEVAEVPYGVPQGSVLGPLLFIIYVNDLLHSIETLQGVFIEMYADDTVIYTKSKDVSFATYKFEEALLALQIWCNLNKLTINKKKTKVMLVPRNDTAKTKWEAVNICPKNEVLGKVSVNKYVGVDLDESLSLNVMIDTTYNKANRKVYLLKRIRPYISAGVAHQTFKTCILPILDYADFLVDNSSAYNIKRLNSIQRRGLKVIDQHQHRNADTDELMNIYGYIQLEKRSELHICSIMFRLSKRGENIDNYKPNIRLRNRNKIKFKVSFTSLTKVLKSPFYRGVKMWDRLNEDTHICTKYLSMKYKEIAYRPSQ